MDKTAIKNFAIWARNKLIKEITYKAGLVGVTEKGIADALPQSTKDMKWFDIGTSEPSSIEGEAIRQREKLLQRIQEKEKDSDYKTAYTSIIEEVAYTWFNRLIAIRFMEVNDYLPSRVRVLSSETLGKEEPDLVTSPFDTDLEFTSMETGRIMQYKDSNQLDELFRMLFIKQCNKLNEILPELFEKTSDYTELLLNISYTDKDGVVYHLTHDIDADDFCVKENEEGQVTGQIEIIGWLYQYYNTEQNEIVYDGTMAKARIPKELLPAATTIFTPDWAVRYMVENSLGKLWLETKPVAQLKSKWKYYLGEIEDNSNNQKVDLENIKIIDPCMGSGHVLVYIFDVLMDIYSSMGYSNREAVKSILENNIYGIDISDRAYQIAYFAVMMKARQHDRRFLSRAIYPKLYAIKESNNINKQHLQLLGRRLEPQKYSLAQEQLQYLIESFKEAKEYGSILKLNSCNWELLWEFVNDINIEAQMSLESIGLEQTQKTLVELINTAKVLKQKYDVVITNPPYLGSSRFSSKLDKYVKENYPEVKSDLSMVMFKHAIEDMCKKNGFVSFITTSSWMFISSFEKLRKHILSNYHFESIIDFGTELFEGKVGHNPIVAWVNRKMNSNKSIVGIRLIDYCYSRRDEKQNEYFNIQNRYVAQQECFTEIPGSPIAYWVSKKMVDIFRNEKPLSSVADTRRGLQTGNAPLFVRLWHEVSVNKIFLENEQYNNTLKFKWYLFNSGGRFRRWYGNIENIVNWENNGQAIKSSGHAIIPSEDKYFKPIISWNKVTSGKMSVRYQRQGIIPGDASPFLFSNRHDLLIYSMGLMNSHIAGKIVEIISPTLNFEVGNISKMPLCDSDIYHDEVIKLVKENIEISKGDWDSFETSYGFMQHPLVIYSREFKNTIEQQYTNWKEICQKRYFVLKNNEESINRIFIDIYGLKDEVSAKVEDNDITIRKANLISDIRSLVSYFVGCIFGRYSLDKEGIIYAGGEWDNSNYASFIPNKNNIIIITEDEYFTDDIINRFVEFIKVVYGEETLEENLDFIANVLGNKGNTSREVIRNYFAKDFYKDHCKTYQKRPIYWLFDSGKQNGFKALIYMHRYDADTIGNLRIDYLHRLQKVYESEVARMQDIVDNSNNAKESTAAAKRRDKIVKQLQETKDYDQKIAHLALARTEIDLDDGVKVNYEKIQTGTDGKKLKVLAKI